MTALLLTTQQHSRGRRFRRRRCVTALLAARGRAARRQGRRNGGRPGNNFNTTPLSYLDPNKALALASRRRQIYDNSSGNVGPVGCCVRLAPVEERP